jgi:hypothetical protein
VRVAPLKSVDVVGLKLKPAHHHPVIAVGAIVHGLIEREATEIVVGAKDGDAGDIPNGRDKQRGGAGGDVDQHHRSVEDVVKWQGDNPLRHCSPPKTSRWRRVG